MMLDLIPNDINKMFKEDVCAIMEFGDIEENIS
jgi:hypothetical protein